MGIDFCRALNNSSSSIVDLNITSIGKACFIGVISRLKIPGYLETLKTILQAVDKSRS